MHRCTPIVLPSADDPSTCRNALSLRAALLGCPKDTGLCPATPNCSELTCCLASAKLFQKVQAWSEKFTSIFPFSAHAAACGVAQR